MRNDFTKAELNYLLERIDNTWESERKLSKKVSSLIDNYCEHDWHEGSMGSIYWKSIYCKNCKHRINFKMQGF